MTTFTATFADGTSITRNSDHGYTVAWRATWTEEGRLVTFTGFSARADKINADKPGSMIFKHYSAAKRAELARKNTEILASTGYKLEVVPAVAA